ncbi:L,D-transpeptidase family protein [Aquisalinus flavus]|uniref:Peptidoglycan-binding protein n=1 Tax=Aquisalinus flavus TaxID=1526572 RepID=A0A8J2V6P8_9PROT|nr:L,D-transpeptidase family protein [Aquisalinus flavus]MBD0426423.1 L,D-transpeptidase family protein [Aquisalinus flavus]GGD08030.1 peptidoglycan-binding protein [Aquisalinus flavus]
MTHKSKFMAVLLSASCIILPACSPDGSTARVQPASDQSAQDEKARLTVALQDQPEWIQAAYSETDYRMIWTGMFDRPTRNYDQLIDYLREAEEDGVMVTSGRVQQLEDVRHASPVEREMTAARVFAETVEELRNGVTTPQFEIPDVEELTDRTANYDAILQQAYMRDDPAELINMALEDNFIVTNLLDARKEYRAFKERGGWEQITFDERKIEVGATDEAIPLVRARLEAEGFDAGQIPEDPTLYDENLEQALMDFQRTRSMMEDGVIGPNTIEALNESVDDLIAKIEINIERARWLPESLGDKAAFVNIADYKLRMLKNDRIVDEMDVIVGTVNHQTPVFSDKMETVVINPYWNVPSSITIEEIAPQQLNNSGYIASQNMEVLAGSEIVSPSSVDWSAAANGDLNFRVRQRPGDNNALGLIKFLFPNKYAVYLHDSPAEQLFSQDLRTFSHGCIRLEDPMRFAEFVTENASGWDRDRVEQAIASGERIEFALDEQFPVYITYFTAWAGPEGNVSFARDVYERDGRIAGALQTRI